MTCIEWNDDLSVGIGLIDEQHKTLIQRLAQLSNAVNTSKGASEILKSLEFMYDYTNFHFADEEKQMEKYNYPGLEGQKKMHAEFIKAIKQLEEDFEEEGATGPLADSINTFLMNWLVKHIKGEDAKFGTYINENNIEIKEE
ncbi:MAG: hemerythrin family protein [Thermoplasmata archaeon]|nr:hemerythrin family protein [Thermoplasmata archaeon]